MLRRFAMLALALAACISSIACQRPSWHFSVVARVPVDLVDKYQGTVDTEFFVRQQLSTINNRYQSSGAFRGDIVFDLAAFEVISDTPEHAVERSHPGYDFALVYQETEHPAGGWRGDHQAILHSWCTEAAKANCTGNTFGVFSSTPTQGLVHEFGHSRGGVDLYALEVQAAKNPFTHTAWSAPVSVMNNPFGVTTWDPYSVSIVDRSAGTVYSGAPVVNAAFPSSITVKVLSRGDVPVNDVKIDVFPVPWFSGEVKGTAVLSGSSSSGNNTWTMSSNPFKPGASGKPWNLAYPNFLVRARGGFGNVYVGYAWLPLTDVGNHAFATGNGPFTLTIYAAPTGF